MANNEEVQKKKKDAPVFKVFFNGHHPPAMDFANRQQASQASLPAEHKIEQRPGRVIRTGYGYGIRDTGYEIQNVDTGIIDPAPC